jgi:hypothetical protein
MQLAVIALIALACATAVSVLAFMIGRCSRKLVKGHEVLPGGGLKRCPLAATRSAR